jgi:hypothetical protein
VYIGLGVAGFIIYVFLLVYFGVKCFKNGHMVLFILGLIPALVWLWIIGGMMPPKGMSRIDAMYAEKERTS